MMMMFRSNKNQTLIKSALSLLVVVWLQACSTMQSVNESMPWFSGNEVESIGLKVNFDAQLQHAISVDVVFVYDENLIALLSNADAGQWFAEKQGYISNYGFNMDILHREIVPGYSELIMALPEKHSDAKAVIAFAYYPLNPNAKAVLTEIPTPWLLFDAQNMQVMATAPTLTAAPTNSGAN